ncbi:YppE family protein [Listeria welshimeri]|uniref:YppE family protein n=1 Tax=Listeria welshimeri TaxID=1643 RepID=UPI001886D634|nr:YppE family protein [Listeria welshimeri]MBF2593081.1 YppE family protein [Listeria welshimeri]
MELLERTEKLLLQNEKNWELYLSNREEAQPFDFYKDMKPFVDEAKACADAFLELAIPWVIKERPPYLGELQLRQACDNIQMTAVSAFNGKSFYKHFLDHYQSSQYTLKRVRDFLKRKEELM